MNPTTLRLGPSDHGRALSRDEYERADYMLGHQYELVAGRLYVTPFPNPPHDQVEQHLLQALRGWARIHPETMDYITTKPRIITTALGGETDPQPDIAAYSGWPAGRVMTWEGLTPILVVEVVSPSDPNKDLVRNRQLYWEVPGIEEYWIVDPRPEPDPSAVVLRRGDQGWIEHPIPAGGILESELLTGFCVDLSAIFSD